MPHISSSMVAAALLSITVLQATPALAQHAFVAARGSDTNPCTFAAPCRTFQHAHDTVAANGAIDVLDPADYGALTITKAITIEGRGFASIAVAGGATGITVNATLMDAVSLSGLVIEGGGIGANGIVFSGAKSLAVENCVVRKMSGSGLFFARSVRYLQSLSVSNSYFTDNSYGIRIQPQTTGTVAAAIERVALSGNAAGLWVYGIGGTGAINVAVTDSVAANNNVGFAVHSEFGHSVSSLVLTHATAAGNVIGVRAIAGVGAESRQFATVRIAQSTVTGNLIGYEALANGVILSYGDNYIDVSAANVGTLGSATKQ
jgi:Right handed beta helix region